MAKKEVLHGDTIVPDELFDATTGEFVVREQLVDFARGHGPGFAGFHCEGPSATRQEFAAECDINEIMKRNEPIQNWFDRREPQYLDTTELPDNFQSAMNLMISAQDRFMQLNAHIRREFDNDPVRFVDFAADPQNLPKLREWGLAPPAPPPPPAPPAPPGPAPESPKA